jgi:hypothetical protein
VLENKLPIIEIIDIVEETKQYNIPVDFVIDLSNSDYLECPKEYNINNMLQKHKFLANLWKNILLIISIIEETNIEFRIGWTFDPEKQACYVCKDGEKTFLINPTIDKFSQRKDLKKLIYNIVATACHEWVHLDYTYHDESFAGRLTELTGKVFSDISWREMVENSRKDRVFCN